MRPVYAIFMSIAVTRSRDRLADAAEAEDPDGLAAELGRELRSALQPSARVHEAIEAHEAAPRHHDQRDRHVGDVVGQHVRRVGHLEPALLAVLDGHAVVADAEHRDDLELRQRIEQRGRRHRAAALHEPADLAADRGEERRLVGRLHVIVAVVVGLQRIVEERRQRRGDDDVVRHGVSCLSRGWAANHSSKPAMRPSSPPAVSTHRQARARARARRCADAARTSGNARHAARVGSSTIAHRLSSAFARRDRDRVDAACANASASPAAPLAGGAAPIARDRNPRARRARAAYRPRCSRPPSPRKMITRLPRGVGELGQREQALAVEARRRERARRRCRVGQRHCGAGTRRERDRVAAGQRRASGAPYSTALARHEHRDSRTPRAPHARVASARGSAGGRIAIAGKMTGVAAQRGDSSGETGRLARRPRHQDAEAGERCAG